MTSGIEILRTAPSRPRPYPHAYVALQTEFARAVANRLAIPVENALLCYTNLYRMLGLDWTRSAAAPRWQAYLRSIQSSLGGRENELASATYGYYREIHAVENLDIESEVWGCFSYWYDTSAQQVRLKFFNRDRSPAGPLSEARLATRQGELRSMLATIRARHPAATHIRGSSWLYSRAEYRRLFPDEFVAELEPQRPRFTGRSLWGQFLTSEFELADGPTRTFRAALRDWAGDVPPHELFPHGILGCSVPIEVFLRGA